MALSNSSQGQGFSVGNYQVLSSTRVGRTEFEYVIRVTVSNQVASAVGVTAQVFSMSPNTVVIQGDVSFGDVALAASAVSANTITIRQNRLSPFNPADLMWFVAVKSMPLSLTVNSPVSGFLTNGTNVVVSGTFGSAVDGVLVGHSPATISGNSFTGTFALEEGRNTISVLASNHYGGSGLINVFVTRDTTPPLLNIETPANGTVLSKRQVTISGLVNDAVPGTVNPEQASVMVNGLAATILNRSFSIPDVLLVPGTNIVTAIARDKAGNEKQGQVQLVFIDPASQKHLVPLAGDAQTAIVGTVLPQPLLVELVDGDGVVQTNQPVTFAVTRNDGILFAPPDSGRNLTVQTDDKGQAKVLYQLGTRTGVGNNHVVATSPGVNGQLQFEASAVGAAPAKISPLIPETQVGEVGKPLSQAWTVYATDSGGNPVAGAPIMFVVSQGGGNLGGATTINTNTDSDGRAFVTLTLGPDEGVNNNVVLATSPGVTNSAAVFTASGQTPGAVNDTRVVGLVLDNANRPMSNILCVIANTTRATVTDQQGQFVITRAPVGAIRLLIDAQNRGYPGEWHSLQFNMVTVAGRDNSLDRPIYMVQVDTNSAAIAGGAQDITLSLKDFPGASLTIFAHSVRNDQGQPITNRVTWTQVNNERIPMAPPQGSQPVLTTAILPAGLRFNPPAKMCIPNTGLPPGQILELYGFDHDIGSFVSVGTATVSSDGGQICSDPGFGIVKSGWHPLVPPPPPCTQARNAPCPPANTPCYKYLPIPVTGECVCPYGRFDAKIKKLEPKANGKKEAVVCLGDSVQFTSNAEAEYADGIEYEWKFGDGLIFDTKSTEANPSFTYPEPGNYTVTVKAKCKDCDSASSSKSLKVHVVEIKIVDQDGNEITGGVPATVAIKSKFKVEVEPSSTPGADQQWVIDGATPPSKDIAIKTYAHATEGPHTPKELTKSDMQAKEFDLFWTVDGAHTLAFQVIANKGTPDESKCEKSISVTATQDTDPNRNIYTFLNPDEDHNPDGSGGIYEINKDHAGWHGNFDQTGGLEFWGITFIDPTALKGTAAFDGAEFFNFHKRLIDANNAWRTTFHVAAIPSGDPTGGGYLTPTYLSSSGGPLPSRIYGYVRLGECGSLNEAGDIAVVPWHDGGHGFLSSIDRDMRFLNQPIHSRDSLFWQWHGVVDTIRATWSVDTANVSSTTPDTGATDPNGRTQIIITFDRPVSWDAPPINTVQVTASALRVNGVQAISVTTDPSDHRSFLFTLPAPIAAGPASAVLTGTRSFSGHTWSFSVAP